MPADDPPLDLTTPQVDLGTSSVDGGGDDMRSGLCKNAADCPGLTLCDPTLKRCVACVTSGDCATDEFCKQGACQAAMPCMSDLECRSLQQVCDPYTKHCVECNASSDCKGNDAGSLPNGTACILGSCIATRACMSSLECPSDQVCGKALPPTWPPLFGGKACMQCSANLDCPTGMSCRQGLCEKACVKAGRSCGGFATGPGEGVNCGSCAMGSDCSPMGLACLPIDRRVPGFGASSSTGLLYLPDAIFVGKDSSRGTWDSVIVRIDRKSGAVTTYPTNSNPVLFGPVANATHVYFVDSFELKRIPLSSDKAEKVRNLNEFCMGVPRIDDTNAYCSSRELTPTFWEGLIQFPLAGGPTVKLGDSGMTPDGITEIVPRGSKVLWTVPMSGFVGYSPVGGGTPVRLASRSSYGLVADDQYAYYGLRDLYRAPLAGGPEEVIAMSAQCVTPEVLSGGAVYCKRSFDAGLVKIDVKTGKETVLVEWDVPVQSFTVEGKFAYIFTGATLYKIPIP